MLARAVVHVLSLLPQPMIPPEVWSIQKVVGIFTRGSTQARSIAREGHVLPDQLISESRRRELVNELVEMLPMSNVRLLREVLGVSHMFDFEDVLSFWKTQLELYSHHN